MAIVNRFENIEKNSTVNIGRQTETESRVKIDRKNCLLQIETFGSCNREHKNSISQNIVFKGDSLVELKRIVNELIP